LATCRAEVVRAALVRGAVLRLVRIDGHAADGVDSLRRSAGRRWAVIVSVPRNGRRRGAGRFC
jgi:hypothetical protein